MAIRTNDNIDFFQRRKHSHGFEMKIAHFHDYHELYFLQKGSTRYFIGNKLYILNAGDFIFVPKGEFHQTSNQSDVEVERLIFVFDNKFAGNEYLEYVNELTLHKHVQIDNEHLKEFYDLFAKIEYESAEKPKAFAKMQRLYLRQLLIMLSRYRKKTEKAQMPETYSLIQEAAKYISANCNSDLCLETLSKKYAVSRGYFSKQFKSITGVPLNEYINISRIAYAQKLLESTDMPITEIAVSCGFNDSNYFAQVFKKIRGITPKKYAMQFKSNTAIG